MSLVGFFLAYLVFQASSSALEPEVAVVQALAHLQKTGEYQLVGTRRLYNSNGELFSIARERYNVRTSDASYRFVEQVASNVQIPEAISTRDYTEWLSKEGEFFLVRREISEERRLSEQELEQLSGLELGDEFPWQLSLEKDSEPKFGQILLSGRRSDLNLLDLLENCRWEVSQVESGVVRLMPRLPDGQGLCYLDLDVDAGYRPIRLERFYKAGDIFRGNRLPTDDVQEFREISAAVWERDRLISLTDETQRKQPTGELSGFRVELAVESAKFGEGVAQMGLQSKIPDGTPVHLKGSPQIQLEWRDGEIIRVYDSGMVESLRKIEMQSEGSSWVFWVGSLVVALGVVAFILTMRKRK
jgi:hypothetical protein